MLQFRVTKYDPALRNAAGAYLRDEWISHSDIGKTFEAGVLTQAEYERVEQSYIDAALAFMKEAGVHSLEVQNLESFRFAGPLPNGMISIDAASEVIRSVLRDQYWCRLQGQGAFIHIGWDYYMYVGVPTQCPGAIAQAKGQGLFVEPFVSPYLSDE